MEDRYTVVIPTLNEEGNIGVLTAALKGQDSTCDVLVVDSFSKDKTVDEAEENGARVITRPGSVSVAIAQGIQEAETERIIIMDGDLSHSSVVVPAMAEQLKTHDMVYGYRERSQDSLLNKFISKLGIFFTLFLIFSVKDRMTGFFGGRQSNLKSVTINEGPKPFLEYLLRTGPSSIEGFPYLFISRVVGKSKLGRGKILFIGIRQLIYLHFFKYSQVIRYCMVGGSGFGLFIGLVSLFENILGFGRYTSLLIPGGLVFFYNFSLHKLWTFTIIKGLSLRQLPNMIWNLGHDNDDGDFDWWEYYSGWPHKRFKRTLAKHIRDLAGDGESILSLGCGSSPILNLFSGKKVGVDLNPEKIKFFQYHSEATLFECDIINMKVPAIENQAFDVILCNEVMEHLDSEDLSEVVTYIQDHLTEGGRVVLSTPDTGSKLGKFVENFLHGEFHSNLMDRNFLVTFMRDRGFELVEERNFLWDRIYLFMIAEEVVEGKEVFSFA